MAVGNAIKFPYPPSVGMTRPQYNRLDKPKMFTTEGNNITRSRLEVLGNQARGSFSFYKMDDLDEWYMEYLDHVYQSRPVFFRWSNLVDDPIYGRQNVNSISDVAYVNSFYARFDYEFNGYAKR